MPGAEKRVGFHATHSRYDAGQCNNVIRATAGSILPCRVTGNWERGSRRPGKLAFAYVGKGLPATIAQLVGKDCAAKVLSLSIYCAGVKVL